MKMDLIDTVNIVLSHMRKKQKNASDFTGGVLTYFFT